MSIFNINPMPDDEENTDIPPYVPQNEIGLAPDNHDMPPVNPMHPATTQPAGDIKLNNRPEIPYQDTFAPEPMQPKGNAAGNQSAVPAQMTSKANAVPVPPPATSAATPAAAPSKPALSEFEQYKQMYPDDAIQKYVESFRPNPSDDRSARFAKYAKLNAIGQGLMAIANMVGASHGAKIYAPQQNNTTQQLIGAAEQEKAKQEAKEEKYNLMKYQSALNTLNGYKAYKAALAKQNHEDEQNKLTRESNENIAKNHDATSVNNTEANNATSKYVSDNNNKSAERRNAASNATALEVAHIVHANDATKGNKSNTPTTMMLNGKVVTVPAAIFNTTFSNLAGGLTADQIAAGGSAYPEILKAKVYNQIAKDYTVDKNGTLVPKKVVTPMQKAVAASPTSHYKLGSYKIVKSSDPHAIGTVIPEADLYGRYTHEQLEQAIKAGNIQKVN